MYSEFDSYFINLKIDLCVCAVVWLYKWIHSSKCALIFTVAVGH